MGQAEDNCQFPKIFVQGYKDAILAMGKSKNFFIAWVFFPIARPNHIMSSQIEWLSSAAPDTGIEQNFHPAVLAIWSSTRSWLTSRLA